MKFCCSLILCHEYDDKIKIPSQYRRNLLSLVKEALLRQNTDPNLMEKYFGGKKENRTKPFSVSLHIPHSEVKDGYMLLKGNTMKLYFATSDVFLGTCIYNGLRQINKLNWRKKSEGIAFDLPDEESPLIDKLAPEEEMEFVEVNSFAPFPPYRVIYKNFHTVKIPETFSDVMVYKTISPLVVRKFDERGCTGYLQYREDDFVPNLRRSIISQAKHALGKDYSSDISVELIKGKTDIIPLYCNMPAYSGLIKLTAPPEVQEMACHTSIGAHRSTCGMLEVLA